MFRHSARRAFSSINRHSAPLPKASPHIPDGSTFTVQRVRFTKGPFFTTRRLTNFLVYCMPIYFFFKYAPIAIEISLEDDEAEKVGPDGKVDLERNNGEEEDEEFEGDEDAWFFPMTWPKQQPRRYYRGTDPEWLEFLKLARDPKRHKEVHQQLVRRIRSEVSQFKHAKRLLGRIEQDKGRFWLDTTFPDGPPQVYEARGIEIGDDYIAWAGKDLEQAEFDKIKQALLPTAALWSTWASMRYLLEKQANTIKSFLGLRPTWTPEVEKSLMMAGIVAPGKALKGLPTNPKTGATGDSTKDGKTPSARQGSDPSSSTAPVDASSFTGASGTTDPKNMGLPKSSPFSSGPERPITLLIFLSSMRRQTHKTFTEPPRGCVRMSGLVEIVGKNGRLIMDVAAAYNPGTDEFPTTYWQAKTYQPRAQRPKGDRV